MSTQPSRARILIPLFVLTVVLGVTLSVLAGRGRAPAETSDAAPAATDVVASIGAMDEAEGRADDQDSAGASGDDSDGPATDGTEPPASADETGGDSAGTAVAPAVAPAVLRVGDVDLTGLRAIAPGSSEDTPASLGSLDPSVAAMEVLFSNNGAGIARIAFADIWETAEARRQAAESRAATAAGDSSVPMPEELRYVLTNTRTIRNARFPDGQMAPELAAVSITIEGQSVSLLNLDRDLAMGETPVWSEFSPGRFVTEVHNADGRPIVRINREFRLVGDYELELDTSITNLTGESLQIQWWQYGPGDLRVDRARYMDRRRYRFGLAEQAGGAGGTGDYTVRAPARGDGMLEHRSVEKRENPQVWPFDATIDESTELSWFAITNRYFAFAVHPPVLEDGTGDRRLTDEVQQIVLEKGFDEENKVDQLFTYLASPPRTLEPNGTTTIEFGVFAGPLDRQVLNEPRYTALSMDQLILFQMSSFCAVCTFQWLAHLLLAFLNFLDHSVVFDWGVAIICLVIVVRLILHPITKKSQIGMQKFGRAMQAMKPEIEKLQKKYPDDPKRMQAEQMRLMQQHGVSPLQALGCLPMFLQTPIWIALYAMLYFAFDIRHEPAFYGIFQTLSGGNWSFLSDLSSGDHFFWVFDEPKRVLLFNLTGINMLPLLMGGVFFVQQKYMTPPPSPSMTPEQIQQQKIMKVMMIVLFPIMLYGAPSGLTLYILTSSTIGVLESRYIRKHVDAMMDKENGGKGGGGGGGGGGDKPKPSDPDRDKQQKAMNEALEAKRKMVENQARGPIPNSKRPQ